MKINYDKKATETCISELKPGTFFSKRNGDNENELYMIIDKNSGLFFDRRRGRIMAVSLTTGKITPFMTSEKVELINSKDIF